MKRKVIEGDQYIVIPSPNSNANVSVRCHGSARVLTNRGGKITRVGERESEREDIKMWHWKNKWSDHQGN